MTEPACTPSPVPQSPSERTSTPDSKKSEKSASSQSPRKSVGGNSGDVSPRKAPRNGVTSPSKTARTPSSDQKRKGHVTEAVSLPTELPPIKAPVGQAPSPNVRNVKSKIGSLDNIKYKPGGGDKKVSVTSKKLEWQAQSKVGSMENATHKPGGGDKKISSIKLDFKDKAQPKVGSKDMIKHQAGGGQVKPEPGSTSQSTSGRVETQKLEFKDKATSKVGSMDNVKHRPGGGNVLIKTEKLTFKDRASPKIGSLPGSDMESIHGSNSHSPVPVTSPNQNSDTNSAAPASDENGQSPKINGELSPDSATTAGDSAPPQAQEGVKC